MQNFKNRWEITKNWQLIYPFLGIIAALFSGFLIGKRISSLFPMSSTVARNSILLICTLLITYLILKLSLWCFKKLKNKWKTNYRWEYIAIFLCFAVTGSTAGKVSNPIMEFIGLAREATSGWIYWPVRILLIFPIYQVLLVIFGWIFGQYNFFKEFATKMVSRMGLGFIFKI